jgi:predicted YcjX-like family ATPase
MNELDEKYQQQILFEYGDFMVRKCSLPPNVRMDQVMQFLLGDKMK